MYAILRTYNTEKILETINNLQKTKFIKQFFVIINANKDYLNTPKLISEYYDQKYVLPIPIDNYGWAKALNSGIRSLPTLKNKKELVLVVSNEIQINKNELSLLKQKAVSNNASCGYSLFKSRDEPTYRVPRNTYIVWQRQIFEEVGLFDESLDDSTGMEDYEMVLRSYANNRRLPFLGAKNVDLKLRIETNLEKKLEWELRGIKIIEKNYPNNLIDKIKLHLEQQNKEKY